MQKLIILLLTLTLILGVFASCNSKRYLPIDDESSSSPSEDTANAKATESNEISQAENTGAEDKLSEITSETNDFGKPSGILRSIYTFHSFDEFKSNFSKDSTEKNSKIQAEKNWFGENHLRFIEFLNDNNDKILRPLFNGEPMYYYEDESTQASMIELSTEGYDKSIYSLPCIYYYLKNGLIVSLTYPDKILSKDFSSYNSASDVLKAIDYNSVNIHNYTQFPDDFKNVYTKEIQMGEETVLATVYERYALNLKFRIDVYYDGMYISLDGSEDILTNDFWQGFSME